ncbi:MAG: MBL fold metallo-hydrolase [Clostridiales Family XIII bacterium]|jgi:glyoxylase-like metal-dependent hydrolase (beta-lactamase superfamily II)|nr:MBL fold metallo-hydrolase [Clostridiales Family XIII bacterium]
MYETLYHGNNIYSIEDEIVRAFFIVGDEKALLVDSCLGGGDIVKTCESITDKRIILLNTHADDDHTGGNASFGKTLMHPAEFAWYSETSPERAARTPPEAIWEGESVDIGGAVFEIIHIPGHTPGSIALIEREQRILIAGDSVSLTPVFIFSPFRSIRAYAASMEKLLALAGDVDVVYASHGPAKVDPGQIRKQLAAARKLMAGELTGAPPPFELPALMYEYGGAAFFL